jgi:hypothetical protein
MKAYAELVADLAKTLNEFKTDNVTDAEITAHLAANYPDGGGGTSVRWSYVFRETAADEAKGIPARTAQDNLKIVANALVSETKNLSSPLLFDFANDTVAMPEGNTTNYRFKAKAKDLGNDPLFVDRARDAVGTLLAKSMIEHLRAMAREGMARIVISEGELLSKLTFQVQATDQATRESSNYRDQRLNIGAKLRFGGKSFGASIGVGFSNIKVSTSTESSSSRTDVSAEVLGMVHLKFRTETFPPIVTAAPIV